MKSPPLHTEEDPLCPFGFRFLFQGEAESSAHFAELLQEMFLPLYPTMINADVVRVRKGKFAMKWKNDVTMSSGDWVATTRGFTAYIRKDVQAK